MSSRGVGRCEYCGRGDARLYDQPAGVHNGECDHCHPLYRDILKLQRALRCLSRWSGRDWQRAMLREARGTPNLPEAYRLDDLPPDVKRAAGEVIRRLDCHPAKCEGANAERIVCRTIETLG